MLLSESLGGVKATPRLASGFQSRPSPLHVPGCGEPSEPCLTSEPRRTVLVAGRAGTLYREMA